MLSLPVGPLSDLFRFPELLALVVDEGTDSAGADIVLLNFLVAAYLAPLEVVCLLLPVSGLVFGCLRLVACRSGH